MFWLLSVTIIRDCQYFYTTLLQLTSCIIVSSNNAIINKPQYIPLNYTEGYQGMWNVLFH
jgi:hypothetical protein